MTQKERDALQGFVNQIVAVDDTRTKAANLLRSMSRERGLPVWKSPRQNARQLEAIGVVRAGYIYERYLEQEFKHCTLMDLERTLASIGFWSHPY